MASPRGVWRDKAVDVGPKPSACTKRVFAFPTRRRHAGLSCSVIRVKCMAYKVVDGAHLATWALSLAELVEELRRNAVIDARPVVKVLARAMRLARGVALDALHARLVVRLRFVLLRGGC